MNTVRKIGQFLRWPTGCPFPEDSSQTDNAYFRKWLKQNNPGVLKKTSRGAYTGIGVAVSGALVGLFGSKNENNSIKNAGVISGIGGVLLSVVSECCNYLRDITVETIRINRDAVELVKSEGDVAIDLLRFPDSSEEKEVCIEIKEGTEVEHGKFSALHEIRGDGSFDFRTLSVSSLLELRAYKAEVDEKLRQKVDSKEISTYQRFLYPRSLRVENLEYRVYEAKFDNHTVKILIPEIYVKCRPQSLEKIFEAIEIGLNNVPENLVFLIKEIKLHLGEDTFETAMRIARQRRTGIDYDSLHFFPIMTALNGKIGLHIDSFRGPAQDLDEREKMVINEFQVDRQKSLKSNSFHTSKNGFEHELGHALRSYLIENHHLIRLPSFEKKYFINKSFANNNWNESDDAWSYIIGLDSNNVSEYAKISPNEDFAESVAGYLKDKATFKELYPNRFAFLDFVIPQVIPESERIRLRDVG